MDVPLHARSAESRFRDVRFENHVAKPGPHSFVPDGRVALLFASDEEQGAWREAPVHSCIHIYIYIFFSPAILHTIITHNIKQ